MKIIEYIFITLITASLLLAIGNVGYEYGYDKAINEAPSDYFWIDNDRVSIYSEIYPTPLYDTNLDIVGCSIMIRTDRGDAFKEFLDTDYGTWKELRDSWIMAFQEGVN